MCSQHTLRSEHGNDERKTWGSGIIESVTVLIGCRYNRAYILRHFSQFSRLSSEHNVAGSFWHISGPRASRHWKDDSPEVQNEERQMMLKYEKLGGWCSCVAMCCFSWQMALCRNGPIYAEYYHYTQHPLKQSPWDKSPYQQWGWHGGNLARNPQCTSHQTSNINSFLYVLLDEWMNK